MGTSCSYSDSCIWCQHKSRSSMSSTTTGQSVYGLRKLTSYFSRAPQEDIIIQSLRTKRVTAGKLPSIYHRCCAALGPLALLARLARRHEATVFRRARTNGASRHRVTDEAGPKRGRGDRGATRQAGTRSASCLVEAPRLVFNSIDMKSESSIL
jgi:hypothetical protein